MIVSEHKILRNGVGDKPVCGFYHCVFNNIVSVTLFCGRNKRTEYYCRGHHNNNLFCCVSGAQFYYSEVL